ncbi:MAG TPA: hypothetical protein VM163_07370 [bacterium]|nr:hypothetical protein [bacterium]
MRTRRILSFFSVALGLALVSVPGFCDSVVERPRFCVLRSLTTHAEWNQLHP